MTSRDSVLAAVRRHTANAGHPRGRGAWSRPQSPRRHPCPAGAVSLEAGVATEKAIVHRQRLTLDARTATSICPGRGETASSCSFTYRQVRSGARRSADDRERWCAAPEGLPGSDTSAPRTARRSRLLPTWPAIGVPAARHRLFVPRLGGTQVRVLGADRPRATVHPAGVTVVGQLPAGRRVTTAMRGTAREGLTIREQ